ncbi:MAG TPA: imidazole glycerol phosphate synthase subunit HisH [Steroidobacteraceae bacterium]|nr:imidazole glycerol phosphate synthase subunit HisH [Steroidobacteraceae bacterium]
MGTPIDVAVVDSGGANLASLRFALERLGARVHISRDPQVIGAAPRVLLPGVGAAADAMRRLRETGLDRTIAQLQCPLLGICLGMQLLFENSAEGDTACLGVLPGRIERLSATPGLPVPHMGWNTLQASLPPAGTDALMAELPTPSYAYFVHSYAASVGVHTLATVDYGRRLSAVVRRDNFYGVQFHPERSATLGARILSNFLSCC